MNAPTYIEKNLGKKRDEEKKYELHTKKLKEIQERGPKKKPKAVPTIGKKLKDHKDKTQQFMKNEKNAEINRENKILLDKLVEISNGKFSSVSKPVKKAKKAKKAVQTKKSLNYEKRRKEFERIERENMAIAQRLYNKESSISKKKMDKDFNTNEKYKKQIQKLKAANAKKKKAKKTEAEEQKIEEEKALNEDEAPDTLSQQDGDAEDKPANDEADTKDAKEPDTKAEDPTDNDKADAPKAEDGEGNKKSEGEPDYAVE
ncbi:unnamed protein product [Moneuplotes crassus]|uniref:Uncharacterized protein n=1 Tax=Euplotes crassus TaxID=5936 RepID=A0AAD1XDI8_EUPCR|nr:unnamed protein product [Moneuplotes crassus]